MEENQELPSVVVIVEESIITGGIFNSILDMTVEKSPGFLAHIVLIDVGLNII